PGGERKITLRDLQGTPIGNLVSLATSGGLTATLPLQARLGTHDFGAANPRLVLSTANVFTTPPAVQTPNFDQLGLFTNVPAGDVLGLIGQLGAWFNAFRTTAPFQSRVPFTDGKTLEGLLDLGRSYTTRLLNPLKDLPNDPNAEPTFASAQQLATELVT